jgi:hypothetical protein
MTGPVDGGQEVVQTDGTDSSGINPAWEEYYGTAPQEVRDSYLTPAFKKWDENVNNMVQKVHSEYEPWKPVINQADPQTAQWAISVANQLNTNPQMVYEALGEWLKESGALQDVQAGSNAGQGQQQPNGNNNQDDAPWRPELQNLQQQNRLLTDYLRVQQEAQQNAALDAQLERELTDVQTKYRLSDKDMPFVLGLMANNDMTTESAAKAVYDYQSQFRPKPLIMGSGGGVPGAGIDPSKLDAKGTKNLVVQMLMDNQAQNNQ